MIKICLIKILLLLLVVNKDFIYRAENNVTLKAGDHARVGEQYEFEGELYLVVDNELLRELVKTDSNFSNIITSKVTDMSFLFYRSTMKDPKIETWDVSNVQNMSWMFGLAVGINPNLSDWDTGSVTNFSDMFHGTKKFNGDISKWNTSSGEFFNGMFFDSNFNRPLNQWDMSSAKNLSGMFDDAKYFNQPLDQWNTSEVIDMGGMFAEAISFNQDISMWDVRNVKEMTNMFRNAVNFKQDLSSWQVPLISEEPENFATNSPVIGPLWEKYKDQPMNWKFLLIGCIGVILLITFLQIKMKRTKISHIQDPFDFSKLFYYLSEKNSQWLTKAELDEIIGITNKNLETQKKLRSIFIKKFNDSEIGEIKRVRDENDARSFNYEVLWKKNIT